MLIKEADSLLMIISRYRSCSTNAHLAAVWMTETHLNSTDGKHVGGVTFDSIKKKNKTQKQTKTCNMRRSTRTCGYLGEHRWSGGRS